MKSGQVRSFYQEPEMLARQVRTFKWREQLVEPLAPLSLCCADGWKSDGRFGRLTQLAIHGIGRASLVRKLSSDRGLAGQLWRAPRHVPDSFIPVPNNPPLGRMDLHFRISLCGFPTRADLDLAISFHAFLLGLLWSGHSTWPL